MDTGVATTVAHGTTAVTAVNAASVRWRAVAHAAVAASGRRQHSLGEALCGHLCGRGGAVD
eukprot:4066673-Heterocapsa_arctica.AAC.1